MCSIRRYVSIVFLAQLLIWSLFIPPALARTSGDDVKRLRNQVLNLRRNLERATKEYNRADRELHDIGQAVKKAETNLDDTRVKLDESKEVFNSRMRAFYVQEDLAYLEVLLDSADMYELLERFTYVSRIAGQDRRFINHYLGQEKRYAAQHGKLTEKKKQQETLSQTLKSKGKSIAGELDKQSGLLAQYEAKAKAEVRASSLRRYRQVSRGDADYFRRSRASVGTGFLFPVAGAHGFHNDWGAPRRGHRHQGTDIFAKRGTPAVASVSGSVRTHYSGTGGKMIYLRGDDGNTYVYVHLSGYAVSGGRVGRGQTIGYVGSTGNARGSSPHLHFEIHPGGGRAINPYPILRRAGS